MGEIHFKKQSPKSVMPHWAYDKIDAEEIAQTLLKALDDHEENTGPLLKTYFWDHFEYIVDVIKSEMEPEFVYNHVNSDFGKGVLLGYLLCFVQERYEDMKEEASEDGTFTDGYDIEGEE